MTRFTRRTFAAGSAATLTAAALAACSFDRGTGGGDGEEAPREIHWLGWGGTTWNQNFNLFSPTGVNVTPGTSYVYEPLVRVDRSTAGELLPHLAESWAFNEDDTELTFTLRSDVTWSDGESFTAGDVKFTWDLVLSGETPNSYPFASVETPDDQTVVVTYEESNFADLAGFATRQIVPEHVWADQDVRTWTNPEPVGTGPGVLASFSPQQIAFDLREDYWGGAPSGPNKLFMHASTGDAAKQQIIDGTLDVGGMGWENAEEEFVALDPENNVYEFFPTGASDGLIFNMTQAPYDDVHVRRALRAAVDLAVAAEVTAVGYGVPTSAGLDPTVFSDMLAENQEQSQDIEYAKAQLEEGGWTVTDAGALEKDGETYELRYDVYQPYAEWVTTGQILADQWDTALGLKVSVNQMADAPFTEASSTGDFGMLSYYPFSGSMPYDMFATMSDLQFTPIGEQAIWNYGRFQNEEYDELVHELGAIPAGEDVERSHELIIRIQEILTEEAPFIPTATSGWKLVANEQNWTGYPTVEGGFDYAPNAPMPADGILTLMNLRPKG